jgi:hypothetical protein
MGNYFDPGIREMPRLTSVLGIFIPAAICLFVTSAGPPGGARTEARESLFITLHPQQLVFYHLFTTKQSAFHLVRTGRINFPLLPARSPHFPTAHYTTKMESKVHRMVIVGSGTLHKHDFLFIIYYLLLF